MATWGDQTCQRFEATAVGFETGFSRLRVRPSNRYAIAPHIKTFYTVDHEILIKQLYYYGVANDWINIYFSKRKQLFGVSELLDVTCGLMWSSAGVCLGPRLFVLYVSYIRNISKLIKFVLMIRIYFMPVTIY